MMKSVFLLLFIITNINCQGITSNGNETKPRDTNNPFFAMGFGFKNLSPEDQVGFLQEAGYDGIGAMVTAQNSLNNFIAIMNTPAVKNEKFSVYGVYMPLNLNDTKQRSMITRVLEEGKAQNVPVWLTIRDAEKSATEPEIIDYLESACKEAKQYGTDIVLYPHDRHYALSVEETIPLIEKANCDNLFTTLHLNHELRAGNAHRLEEVVKENAPYAKLASISGANLPGNYNQGSRDWSDVVQALKDSQFDVQHFYKLLKKYAYEGPIAYNNFGIPGDPKIHHRETLAIYRAWSDE